MGAQLGYLDWAASILVNYLDGNANVESTLTPITALGSMAAEARDENWYVETKKKIREAFHTNAQSHYTGISSMPVQILLMTMDGSLVDSCEVHVFQCAVPTRSLRWSGYTPVLIGETWRTTHSSWY